MRIKSLFTLLALALVVLGLVLSLSGCSGGTTQPSSDTEPVATDTTEQVVEDPEPAPDVEETAPIIEVPIEHEEESTDTVEAVPAEEPPIEEPVEQPVLTWARDAGGLNHCDRLSIHGDGRVEAVVCRATVISPTFHGTLTESQLAQVLAWAAEYASFTSRTSEMTTAIRTTGLSGMGTLTPESEAKKQIAAFAADIYFGLTDPE